MKGISSSSVSSLCDGKKVSLEDDRSISDYSIMTHPKKSPKEYGFIQEQKEKRNQKN